MVRVCKPTRLLDQQSRSLGGWRVEGGGVPLECSGRIIMVGIRQDLPSTLLPSQTNTTGDQGGVSGRIGK